MELTRRKILAGAGAVGVAGAAAGFGSSAFFSDQETFVNNRLVAGSLDMKVDWEEHYSDWSADEDDPADSADPDLDIAMNEPGTPADYTAFPPGVEAFDGIADDDYVTGDPLLWVHNDDVSQFMDNTSIDAFPDSDDDGVQDDFDAANACEVLADVGADDGGLSSDDRTNNDVTNPGDPLINLGDVKPGDFGEVTLSFHLCDNPGYVWLNAANVDASENGKTEPEREDDDEVSTDDPLVDGERVELLDEIQTAWWYDDNCDNLTAPGEEGGAGKADIAFILDRSGSMGNERNFLETNIQTVASNLSGLDTQFALIPYEDSSEGDATTCGTYTATDLTPDETNLDFSYDTCGGTENASNAILHALNNLSWRPDATKVLVVLTDEDDDNGSTVRTNALNEIDAQNACLLAVSQGGSDPNDLQQMSTQVNCGDWVEIDDGLSQQNITDITNLIGQVSGGEEIFFQGSLRAALGALTAGNGIPLDGDGGNDFDEIAAAVGDGDPTAESRGCFEPTPDTNCIGFSWWLPLDHGNEVQSDSVQFDLGFYTEQCRHNTGEGMGNAPSA
jgi:hypothetical protein